MLLTQEAKAADGGLNLPQFGIDVQGPMIQEPESQDTCVYSVCNVTGDLNCTAGDSNLVDIVIHDVIDHCTETGDTGLYQFEVVFTPNSNSYDPYVFIALDGGNALTGTCGYTYLSGPFKSPPQTYPPSMFTPPSYDL